jgi:uncharacterized protein YaaR (DUF327 family)
MPQDHTSDPTSAQATKRCRKCDAVKAASEFYAYRGKYAGDGLQAYCKSCCKSGAIERQKTSKGKEYQRRWKKSWHKTDKGKQSLKTNSRRYKKLNPYKTKVRKFVGLAVELGVLIRPETCELCGKHSPPRENGRASIEAHHPDHSKPLEVVWLCFHCHRHADKS